MIICHVCLSYIFRPPQGLHQGGYIPSYTSTENAIQMCAYGVKNTVLSVQLDKNIKNMNQLKM